MCGRELIIKDLSRYQVVVTRNDGCQRFSEFIQLKSCADPATNRAVLINAPVISTNKANLLVPETTTLRAEGCRDVNFQWLVDDKPIKDAKANTLNVNSSGKYSLQIEKYGCVATSNSIQIVAEQLLSAEDEIGKLIKVYPNPTSSKVLVENIQQTIGENYIYLSDNSGKLIGRWQFQDKKEINLEPLPTGIYYLKITTNGKTFGKKLIKN
ncbi:MAG: T9SS type A sorting domain-containing protein [Spirosomaceae bacterium]|nr:T9SS type A sorting domain-containing protein [Spirosomataceae bacterium]